MNATNLFDETGGMEPERPRWESPVEKAIREAQERGEFDDLPGAGKPLTNLGDPDDPLWWVRRKLEAEQLDLSAAMPPALAMRKEAAGYPESLLDLRTEDAGRATLLVSGGSSPSTPVADLPAGAARAVDLVRAPEHVRAAVEALLADVVVGSVMHRALATGVPDDAFVDGLIALLADAAYARIRREQRDTAAP